LAYVGGRSLASWASKVLDSCQFLQPLALGAVDGDRHFGDMKLSASHWRVCGDHFKAEQQCIAMDARERADAKVDALDTGIATTLGMFEGNRNQAIGNGKFMHSTCLFQIFCKSIAVTNATPSHSSMSGPFEARSSALKSLLG
jgi:hypothetical protein